MPTPDFSGVQSTTWRLQFDYRLPQKRQVETYKPVFSVYLRLATCLFHRSAAHTISFMGGKGYNSDFYSE
jgi:hypothetical protein